MKSAIQDLGFGMSWPLTPKIELALKKNTLYRTLYGLQDMLELVPALKLLKQCSHIKVSVWSSVIVVEHI